MSQLEKDRNRIYDIHDYSVDIENFTIYLQGVEEAPPEEDEPGVEYRMANRFIKNMDILTGIDSLHPITVCMKTGGGDWSEGMSIYDAIISAPNPVSIINYSHASSMSSIIFQAANKRIMMPHSIFMIHKGELSISGTAKQVHSYVSFNKKTDEQMMYIYVEALKRASGKASNWSRKRIREWLTEQMNENEEVYLTAEDAVKMGFADEIFTDWASVVTYTEEQLERK